MKTGAMGAIAALGTSRSVIVFSAMLLLAGTVHAQQPPVQVSLEEAVSIALAGEPALRAARAELDVARGLRRQAGLRPNPSLMFERREEPAGTDNLTMVQVSVPLDLFRRSARIDVADRHVEIVDRTIADRARTTVNNVKMMYSAAAAALRDREVADDSADSAGRAVELLRRQVEEGAAPPIDRNLMEVEVQRLEAARVMAAGRADAALFALKRALGLAIESPIALRDTLEALANAPLPVESNLDARADVLEAEGRVRLADARIAEAQSEGRIDVSVTSAFMRMDSGFPQRGFSVTGELEQVRGVFHYLSAGATVTLPLTNRNQGNVDAARAERAIAAARVESVRLAFEAERSAARVLASRTREALTVMAKGVRLARQNLDVVRQTYELGRGTLNDVLAERRRYLEIEREYTAALRDVFEARASLEFAQGDVR